MDILKVIAHLQKLQGYQAGAWDRVIRSARAYAQAKSFGTTLESNGMTSQIPPRSREDTEKYLLDAMLRDIMFAFQEDTLVGQELMAVMSQDDAPKGG